MILVTQTEIICANAGDSRTVLCQSGNAIDLSVDHKPEDTHEKARIERAGGAVHCNRINSDLGVARSLGDF